MRAYWIDRETNTAKAVETDGGLDSIYEMTHCRCIDIACMKVGNSYLDIFVDDEGLLVNDPQFSVYEPDGTPMLAGSIVVLGSTEWGETIGLTEEQLAACREATANAIVMNAADGTIGVRVVMLAEY